MILDTLHFFDSIIVIYFDLHQGCVLLPGVQGACEQSAQHAGPLPGQKA